MELGSRIEALRKRRGLNQSELARALGLKPQAVQAWEKGGGIRPAKFEAIAAALGVTLGGLLLGDEYEPTQPAGINETMLSEALKLLDYDEEIGGEYAPVERARRLAAIYDHVQTNGGEPTFAYIGELTKSAEARKAVKPGGFDNVRADRNKGDSRHG